MDDCDTYCGTPDTDAETFTAEQNKCYFNCLNEKQCKEVVEQDVG